MNLTKPNHGDSSMIRNKPGASFLLSVAILSLGLASCATVPKEVYLVEPSSLLETSPQIYIRSSGGVLRDLTEGMDEEELLGLSRSFAESRKGSPSPSSQGYRPQGLKKSTIDFVLKRSRTFGAGLSGLSGIDGSPPSLEALMVGDFSSFPIRLGLALDGGWKRTAEGGYDALEYPIHIRPLSPGIVHVSSDPAPRSIKPQLPAYPDAFEKVARSDLFISINDPKLLLRTPFPLEGFSLPLRALALSGNFSDPYLLGKDSQTEANAKYDLELRILMNDEASARMYRPVARFVWAALATRLLGTKSAAASLIPEQEGPVYVVRGILMGTEALKSLLAAVAQGL
ncbi:MAG TPA: hypothetical protein VIO60_08115 [Rectinemataceae bacterium]